MKKTVYLLILIVCLLFLVSCHEGYVSSQDAEALKIYMEPSELKKLTKSPVEDIWIIDVRPAKAYKKGHIPTARSFPSSEIMKRLDEIPKEKYLILYCETGGRAQAVIKKLEKKGYTRLMNWGGFSRWDFETEKEY